MEKFSYLKSTNVGYIEDLLSQYQQDPHSVDPSWRYFFEGMELSAETEPAPVAHTSTPVSNGAINGSGNGNFSAEAKVAELIMAYRELGLLLANTDPLSPPKATHPLLELSQFELTSADLSKTFSAGHLLGIGAAKLSDIIARARETYCGPIGVEFTHIQNSVERNWLQEKLESSRTEKKLTAETRKLILKRLTESETFERFLHTRYVAQKRFSIEGAEGLIPALDCMIETGALLGAQEFVVGMAHRGRLNVLRHTFGKKAEHILTEFEGTYKTDTSMGEGDVKYHKGYSSDITTRDGKQVHLSLASNPSHLEFINPVIEGVARAKQAQRNDKDRSQVIPIAIHGDAAFAGQGVCYETLNLSQLPGYTTGGTLHVVVNNQVGFTTSPDEGRSTSYSTDLAKMLEVPIFHVNGDDAEALWYVSKLCVEYRQKFKKDVFIDLICYRKHGHNEGDEPSFTQPTLYKKIKGHPSPREVYAKSLIAAGLVTSEEAEQLVQTVTQSLTEAQTKTKAESPTPFVSVFEGVWKTLRRPQEEDLFKTVKTSVDAQTLKEIAERLNQIPSNFHLHPKLNRFFEARLKAIQDGKGIDWGNGEALAFGSMVLEGHAVRLSGQDAGRGTFTHRHCELHDFENGETLIPLNHIRETQARFDVFNSHLSESGVLGFEYGYSIADPNTLVIWEAQFGDFANGAQVIIDQFITSTESKWQRMSGLTLLLPHGFEGQGPEHSSARLERFLQLCGKNNINVCNLTTPAQLFHAFRRQLKREFRKPLVIMSPKKLLRYPAAVSTLSDFSEGSFQEAIDDPAFASTKDAAAARRVILCSGKVYYDLIAEREEKKITGIAAVRVEQIYPWPAATLAKILARYPKAEIIWAQEEPRNMGAWSFVFNTWSGGFELFQEKVGNRPIRYVGREVGAAPAVGSHKLHEAEQAELIQKALS